MSPGPAFSGTDLQRKVCPVRVLSRSRVWVQNSPTHPRIMTVGQGYVLSGSASGGRRHISPNLSGLLGGMTMYF